MKDIYKTLVQKNICKTAVAGELRKLKAIIFLYIFFQCQNWRMVEYDGKLK